MIATFPISFSRLAYDPFKDLQPVGGIGVTPSLIVAASSVPAKDIKGLVEWSKSKPGGLNYSTAGYGLQQHLATEEIAQRTGAKVTQASQVQIALRSFLAAVGVPLSGVQTPPAFKVSDAPIPALKETLPLMQQGAVWEVVVPPGKGAGDQNQQFAQQAVAIQIELGSVK